jgi:hypothetical protein
LRAVATLGGQNHRTAKAIARITANYAKTLRVEELTRLGELTEEHRKLAEEQLRLLEESFAKPK